MPPLRPRLYDSVLRHHLGAYRQMVFLAGPRQVGKTTACRAVADVYLNLDNAEDRRPVLEGTSALARRLGLPAPGGRKPIAALDELHKWRGWKRFLKGFFDTHEGQVRLIVTGSSRLDVYRRGGDSMMGRYFLQHLHPFSVGEIARTDVPDAPVRPPVRIADDDLRALLIHGGFPEPFVKRDARFSRAWRELLLAQLIREDLRDVTRIQEVAQVDSLARLLTGRSGTRLVYRNLAELVSSTPPTVQRWIATLVSMHHGFLVRPWHRRISRSLVKEPKWYLRDWSGIGDPGARAETFVACHLLKAVEGWTDLGLGSFALHYLRDKDQREVDFAVIRDGKPWMLVEVKKGDEPVAPALPYFQRATGAPHAFQISTDAPYRDLDGFHERAPVKLPAVTLLSQFL